MLNPYFESIRIAMDEDTKEEFEYGTMFLWCNVARIEEPAGDTFRNHAAKCIVVTQEGPIWILCPYTQVRDEWKKWLDAASNIQSVLTNN